MMDPTTDAPSIRQSQKHTEYSFVRRMLFPFNGEEPLSLREGLRVIRGWILLFTPGVLLITLAISLVGKASLSKMLLLLLLALLFGCVMFGLMGWLTVSMSNRTARIFQAHRAKKATSARGGRYGS
ncbi:MAG: hypothetical protein PVS3B3_14720 [Ktedonobacteraceae bacterium]